MASSRLFSDDLQGIEFHTIDAYHSLSGRFEFSEGIHMVMPSEDGPPLHRAALCSCVTCALHKVPGRMGWWGPGPPCLTPWGWAKGFCQNRQAVYWPSWMDAPGSGGSKGPSVEASGARGTAAGALGRTHLLHVLTEQEGRGQGRCS